MSATTQSGTPATLPAGVVLALDVVGTPSAPTTGDGIPYSKLDIGVAGASSPVTAANPLPVGGTIALDAPTLAALEFVTIDASALPANAAKEAGGNLDTLVARTVLGQVLMQGGLPVTLASDQQTMESHVQRDFAEQAWLLKLDAASLASRGHGYERATLSDRRGRTTRGTSR